MSIRLIRYPAGSDGTALSTNSCTRLAVPVWFVRNVVRTSLACSSHDQMTTGRMAEALKDDAQRHTQRIILFSHREMFEHAKEYGINVRLHATERHQPRQGGACCLPCHLEEQVGYYRSWQVRLLDSNHGTDSKHILQTLERTACSIPAASDIGTGCGSSKAPRCYSII